DDPFMYLLVCRRFWGGGSGSGRGRVRPVCTGLAARGYGTGVEGSAAAVAAAGVHGFPAVLTSFVGRAGPVREVAGLLGECRLVMVTGPTGWVRPGWPVRWPGRWQGGSRTGY